MTHFYGRIIYLVGVILGIYLAIHFKKQNNPLKNYNEWFKTNLFKRKILLWDLIRYGNRNFTTEAELLYKKVKVLCIILVKNNKNIVAIENTWGKNCNNIKFIYLKNKLNKMLPIKRTKEQSTWYKLCSSLNELELNDFKWFLIINDDTFVVMENLRYLLAPLNPNQTHYIGHTVKFWNTLYNQAQAGYVLSYASLEILRKNLKNNCSTLNHVYWNKEDFYLGKYLNNFNITPQDTRDLNGLARFLPYNLNHMFFPGENYFQTTIYPVKCCSKKAITFQVMIFDKIN